LSGGHLQNVGHCLSLLNGKNWGLWLRRLEARRDDGFGHILVIQERIIRRVADGHLLRGHEFAFADGLPRTPRRDTKSPRSSRRPWSDKRLGSNRLLDLPGWLAPRWGRRLQPGNRRASRLLVLGPRHHLGRILRTHRRRTRRWAGPGRSRGLVDGRSDTRPEQFLFLCLSLPGMNDLPAFSANVSVRNDRIGFIAGVVNG